ncbi:MAG: PilZ domain-containing protein [Porticoccus sp.]|nr:PilZ domain-containing protein [Porticoccus sp.]
MEQTVEKRRYYRINDIVGLTYTVIDTNKAMLVSPSENLGLSLTNLLAEIDSELNQVTNILWHENPTVGKALGLLNKKISIIAAHSLQNEEQNIESYEDMMVNISACGIAFDGKDSLPKGTNLQLSIALKPSNIILHIMGQVIACEKQPTKHEKSFSTRVVFEENNSAQEQLIQHIVQKQCVQIGEKNRKNHSM